MANTPAMGGFTAAGGCPPANTPTVGGFTAAGGFSPANTPAVGGSITAGGCRPPAYAAKILQFNTAQSTWQG